MMESNELKNKAREMPAKIPVESRKVIVAKSRWTCESNWMMALVSVAGWDADNKRNLQVGQAGGGNHERIQ